MGVMETLNQRKQWIEPVERIKKGFLGEYKHIQAFFYMRYLSLTSNRTFIKLIQCFIYILNRTTR